MEIIIKKALKIVNAEGFNGVKYRIILNLCMAVLLCVFQMYDIGSKIIGNSVAVLWILINSYYVSSLFLKEDRGFLLLLSRLQDLRKVSLLLITAAIISLPYFIFIIVQLVMLKAGIIEILYISLLQYIFGISVGVSAGFFHRHNFGIISIILIGLVNFGYNMYSYTSYSQLFSISEMLYSVNSINRTSIAGFLLAIFTGTFIQLILLNTNDRHRKIKLIALVTGVLTTYSGVLFLEFIEYSKIQGSEYMSLNIERRIVKYRGISLEEARNISEIAVSLEKEYNKFDSSSKGSDRNYIINKAFLSDILWKFTKNRPKPFIFKDDSIEINILSYSMLNFENMDLLRNFIEDINTDFNNDILGNEKNKYVLHLMDGFSTVMLKNASSKINFGAGSEVRKYYENLLTEISNSPFKKYSFTKRIAMFSYERYPEKAVSLYKETVIARPSSDAEFVELLKNRFSELYNDKDINNIIRITFENLEEEK